jgi:hypothetical protein
MKTCFTMFLMVLNWCRKYYYFLFIINLNPLYFKIKGVILTMFVEKMVLTLFIYLCLSI